ncbi:hypothetical protein Tco_1484448 [Tanacetum coccineum]
MAANQAIDLQANLQVLNELPTEKGLYKISSVLYQNFPREFWCTAIAYDPNLPADKTQSRPLKEYLIKFLAMNGKKPLILDFKTFTTSTSLHYNNGEYVAHPSPQAVKAELAKIVLEEESEVSNCNPYLTQVIGPALSKKRQKPKSKKTPTKTQVTSPTRLIEDSKQSHSLSSGNVPDPQDLERNIQLTSTGLPSTSLDEGTRTVKTTPCPEVARRDKDSEGLKPPADIKPLTNLVADPSRTDAKYQTSSEVEPDSKPLQLKTFADVQALLLFDDEIVQESDNEEVFTAGEEMDEDIPPTNEEEAVKEDLTLHKKVLKATEAYTKNSNNITELLSLAKTFDFSGLKSLVENVKVALDAHNDNLATWTKSATSMAWNVGPRLTKIKHTQALM